MPTQDSLQNKSFSAQSAHTAQCARHGSSGRLIKYPDTSIVLPLCYFGTVEHYALMSAYGDVTIAAYAPYNKRDKDTHRMAIADVNGPLTLTVPVEKPRVSSGITWSDIKVSTHGSWWHLHRVALESAYGRTPFFEFYYDRLAPFFAPRKDGECESVAYLDIAAMLTVCDILGIPAPKIDTTGLRPDTVSLPAPQPYWQIRADKFGFIPRLSILDLIFSLGPEAPLHLRRLTNSQ
ncbi:MAG: WbqC family protein [Bacteroides sp.]|nr:WbqC family protein [Bacteroides sp.]